MKLSVGQRYVGIKNGEEISFKIEDENDTFHIIFDDGTDGEFYFTQVMRWIEEYEEKYVKQFG